MRAGPIKPNKEGLTTIRIAKETRCLFRQISLTRRTSQIIAQNLKLQTSSRSLSEKPQIQTLWTQIISMLGGILDQMIVIRIMHHIRKNIKSQINSINRKKKNQFLMDRIPPIRLCRGRFLFRTTTICESFQTIWSPILTRRAIQDRLVVLKIFHRAETMTSLKRTFL